MSQPPPEMNPHAPASRPTIPSWPKLGVAGAVSGVVMSLIVFGQILRKLEGSTAGPEWGIIGPVLSLGIGVGGGFLGGVVVAALAKTIKGQLASQVAPIGYFMAALIGGGTISLAIWWLLPIWD